MLGQSVLICGGWDSLSHIFDKRKAVDLGIAARSFVGSSRPFYGVIAITLSGLPDPPTIFNGAAITTAPVGGS
jgi:hypothetical protein